MLPLNSTVELALELGVLGSLSEGLRAEELMTALGGLAQAVWRALPDGVEKGEPEG